MTNKTSFNWQDGLKILLAVITFGFGWFADNQNTVIAYAAVLMVWGIGFLAQKSEKFNWLRGKGPLTVTVFVVSFGLSWLFKPIVIDPFPGWSGDAGSYIPLLSVWLESFFSIVGTTVAFAMSIYNILLAQVLEKLPDAASRALYFLRVNRRLKMK